MPAFAGGLKDDEIAAVIAYFKASWPAATLAQQPKAGTTPVVSVATGQLHGH